MSPQCVLFWHLSGTIFGIGTQGIFHYFPIINTIICIKQTVKSKFNSFSVEHLAYVHIVILAEYFILFNKPRILCSWEIPTNFHPNIANRIMDSKDKNKNKHFFK